MIITMTYDVNTKCVGQHFGECQNFLIINTETNETNVVDNGGNSHKQLVGYIKSFGTNVFICGGIGAPAVGFLNDEGIKVIPGVIGNCKEVLNAYLEGTLIGNESKVHQCGCHHN